jgi:transposase
MQGMVTDAQVRRLMKLRKQKKKLATAAAAAGMDEKTARKYLQAGKLPSQMREARHWRTHRDAFSQVWEEVEKILKRSPTVQAKTLFEYLCREHEGDFQEGQLRTLQRRVQNWRALHGQPKEVMFPQHHIPGQQSQSDFTWMNQLGITIAGVQFDHMLYHFVLSYSNWEAVTICFSESFESLSAGLQNALWELGSLPEEHRTDRMSAAVNNLNALEEFTQRYEGLLSHYGLRGSRTQAGRAHELGDAEQSHYRFKQAVDQELILRGSRDFGNRRDYEDFLRRLVKRRNAMRQDKLKEELRVMHQLPGRRLEDFSRQWVKVSRNSTIRVRHNLYSVDSRLIGERVEVRIFPDHLEIHYGGQRLESMERLRGEGKHRIQYRHIIHSLVRKPGAFQRYRYRQDLFPRILFRIAYDELCRDCPQTADRQYLRILLAAAEQSEERVAGVIRQLIDKGEEIRQEKILQLLDSETHGTESWKVKVGPVKVSLYDLLLDDRLEVRA